MNSNKGQPKRHRKQEITIEDIYQNKNFIRPKEKTLETIFEEPKVSKDGSEHLTSVKRYKRFLHFDDYPSAGKLRKRRNRAKKFLNVKQEGRITRSRILPKLNVELCYQAPTENDGLVFSQSAINNSSKEREAFNCLDVSLAENETHHIKDGSLFSSDILINKEQSSEESGEEDEPFHVPIKVIIAEEQPCTRLLVSNSALSAKQKEINVHHQDNRLDKHNIENTGCSSENTLCLEVNAQKLDDAISESGEIEFNDDVTCRHPVSRNENTSLKPNTSSSGLCKIHDTSDKSVTKLSNLQAFKKQKGETNNKLGKTATSINSNHKDSSESITPSQHCNEKSPESRVLNSSVYSTDAEGTGNNDAKVEDSLVWNDSCIVT